MNRPQISDKFVSSTEILIESRPRPRFLLPAIIGGVLLVIVAGGWTFLSREQRQNQIEDRRRGCGRLKSALRDELSSFAPLGFKNLPQDLAESIGQKKAAFSAAVQAAASAAALSFEKEMKPLFESAIRIAHTYDGERRNSLENLARRDFAKSLQMVRLGAISDFHGRWPESASAIQLRMLHRKDCSS